MSTTPRPRRRGNRLARAGAALAAVASLGGLAAGTASAESTPPADDAAGIFCWKEYDFTRSGNTVTATAVKDCTHYEVPQLLSVRIDVFYYNEVTGQPSGWVPWSSGIGVAKGTCITGYPKWFRHSATGEIIYC